MWSRILLVEPFRRVWPKAFLTDGEYFEKDAAIHICTVYKIRLKRPVGEVENIA